MKRLILALALLASLIGMPGAEAQPPLPHWIYLPVTLQNYGGGDPTMPGNSFWEIITPDGKSFNLTAHGLGVRGAEGLGFPPLTHITRTLPLQHGGLLDAIWARPRTVTITEAIGGACEWGLAELTQVLVNAVRPDRTCTVEPLTLRRHLDGRLRDLDCYLSDFVQEYDEMGEAHMTGVRLTAYDPFFYDPAERNEWWDRAVQQVTVRTIVGKIGGSWSGMGPPNAAGTYTSVATIVEDDTYLYIGGDFLNWDNIANADYIVRRNKATGMYSALNATPLNNVVYKITIAPSGLLYLAGRFRDAGGDDDADYVCRYDPVTGIFSSLNATPLNAEATTLVTSNTGIVYIGGQFTNAGGDDDADYVCQYNPTTGAYLSLNNTPLGDFVNALAISNAGMVYIGGLFTDAGGDDDADYVCRYDPVAGGAFASLNATPLSDGVYALEFGLDGILHIGGLFTNAGGYADADYICQYDGTEFSAMGTGVNNRVYSIAMISDGTIYAGGLFTSAGGITIADHVARWNGSTWTQISIDLPGNPIVGVIFESEDGDLYFGFDTSGLATAALGLTPTVNGSAASFPIIEVYGPGMLQMFEQETTGDDIITDMPIQDGEIVTFDLTPGVKTVESDWSGNRLGDIYPISDLGTFSLAPDPIAPGGQNVISVYISGQPVEAGDGGAQLSGWENLTGVTPDNSNEGRLYVMIDIAGGNHLHIYSDAARTVQVAHTDVYAGPGLVPILLDGGSGLGGTVTVDALGAADDNITVDFAMVNIRWYDRFWTLADALAD